MRAEETASYLLQAQSVFLPRWPSPTYPDAGAPSHCSTDRYGHVSPSTKCPPLLKHAHIFNDRRISRCISTLR
ncbi:uncharacterized protein STEHIDRAFT_150721 [Stereum hirsutum FP-91666 SS1]|uniref:Uncharacterized protein n=1 Tax=Stereum hirsutum (strain FP-91666) TaxID=721885 RepID=R7RXI9_STEHR|nr:uncharacterized protein STEHIDRAFT_150721 [Stereum hirsutum FP-91666 SS1]EIM80121.1 hypothetical protein STEHIDRAFT_150721 [Stereum hirsutum FP-91666 SS1]